MKQRFGDNEQTVVARITHRKQRENENVQAYVDEMNMLCSQASIPEAMKSDILIDNLKPNLRTQVIATIPKTIEEVSANAIYLEERATEAVAKRLKMWEQQRTQISSDPVERMTRSMERMALALHNNYNRKGARYDDSPNQLLHDDSSPTGTPRNDLVQCWKCQEYGHRAADCIQPTASTNYACANLLGTHTCNFVDIHPESDDYTPSTPEAELYVADGRIGSMRRAPKHKTAFTTEDIQAARDARANRGSSAASGSGAGPTPSSAPRTGLSAPRPSQPGHCIKRKRAEAHTH